MLYHALPVGVSVSAVQNVSTSVNPSSDELRKSRPYADAAISETHTHTLSLSLPPPPPLTANLTSDGTTES